MLPLSRLLSVRVSESNCLSPPVAKDLRMRSVASRDELVHREHVGGIPGLSRVPQNEISQEETIDMCISFGCVSSSASLSACFLA